MKKITTQVLGTLCLFLLILSCSEDEELTPAEIVLTTSSTTLLADGNDAVTIKVEVLDGNAAKMPNSDYEIYINGEIWESSSFKTNEVGEYRIVARINSLKSNEVVLTATDPGTLPASLSLTASSESLIADGEDAVTFEVEVLNGNNETIENAGYEIFINEQKINSNSFSTSESGEYKVIAKIDALQSNELVLEAIHPNELAASIKLSASSETIMADGNDIVTFEVEAFDEDQNPLKGVDYEIYVNEQLLNSAEFSTTTRGEYKVVVRIQDLESNPVSINAITPEDLVTSLVLETNSQLIIADGASSAALVVKALDKYQEEVPNVTYEILVQGANYNDPDFHTNQPGTYSIVAKVMDVTSNELKITAREPKSFNQITIPVIFHIGHFGESVGSGNNLNASLVEKLLEEANQKFANQNASENPNAVETFISFRLATLDRDNKVLTEPGINRINISKYDVGSSSSKNRERPMPVPFHMENAELIADIKNVAVTTGDIPNDKQLGLDESYILGKETSWPRSEYLNVYVFPIQKDQNLGGYAYYPFVSQDNGLGGFNVIPEGVNVTFGKNEGCILDTNVVLYSHSETLAHEIGHNLGLYHNFSEDNCQTSDYSEDTYSYDMGSEERNPCPGNIVEIKRDNYMDYSGDYNTFTYDQRERMRHVFEYGYFYKDLKNSNK